jgi:hypothetical protein
LGTFLISDAKFNLKLKPYLSAERLRFAILSMDLAITDYSVKLLRSEQSTLSQSMIEQFAGVYLEHMRKAIE